MPPPSNLSDCLTQGLSQPRCSAGRRGSWPSWRRLSERPESWSLPSQACSPLLGHRFAVTDRCPGFGLLAAQLSAQLWPLTWYLHLVHLRPVPCLPQTAILETHLGLACFALVRHCMCVPSMMCGFFVPPLSCASFPMVSREK